MINEGTEITCNGKVWTVADKSIVTPAGSMGQDEWLLKLEHGAEYPWMLLDWELDNLIISGVVTIKQNT